MPHLEAKQNDDRPHVSVETSGTQTETYDGPYVTPSSYQSSRHFFPSSPIQTREGTSPSKISGSPSKLQQLVSASNANGNVTRPYFSFLETHANDEHGSTDSRILQPNYRRESEIGDEHELPKSKKQKTGDGTAGSSQLDKKPVISPTSSIEGNKSMEEDAATHANPTNVPPYAYPYYAYPPPPYPYGYPYAPHYSYPYSSYGVPPPPPPPTAEPLKERSSSSSLTKNSNQSTTTSGVPGLTSLPPSESANRCVPLENPIPSRNTTGTSYTSIPGFILPDFSSIVNYPEYLTKGNRSLERHCVMCGKLCVCSSSGGKGCKLELPIIPRQNKGVCTACDVTVFLFHNETQIKWCKGCKNFRLWAQFGDKGKATKCTKCRLRQKEKYASTKKTAAVTRLAVE